MKKPEGMSREVFALLVQDASSAAAQGISLAPTPKVSEAFKERKTRVGHLWAVSTRGDAPPVQLTQGKGESGALWAPDSSAIAFTANRDGDSGSQIHILPAPGTSGGEARRLTEGLRRVGNLSTWSTDGWIYFTCLADPTPGVLDTMGLIHGFNSPGDKSPYVFEEDMPQTMICRVHVENETVEHLTPPDCTARSWSVSADGSQIVWHRSDSTLLDDARMMPQGTLRTRDSPLCGFSSEPLRKRAFCCRDLAAEL